jgi:type I restriction enzyme S subunit
MNLDKSSWKPCKILDAFDKKEENDRENAHLRFERFLKVEHMDAESLHIKRWSNQSEEDINPTFYKIFRKGQILFPTRNPHLRRTALASFDGICGEKTLTLEPRTDIVLPEFIPFLFHSEGFYEHTTSAIIGSTNPHCRWRDVANYEFLLPPKEEQARLGELLWAMDNVIEREKRVLEKLDKAYVTTIEKEIIDKKSNKIYFKDLGKLIRGVGFKPEDLLEEYSENSFVLLRSNNISDSKVNFKQIYYLPTKLLIKDQLLIPGDYAICMSNGSKDLVGKAARFEGYDKPVSIGSFCAGYRPKDVFSGGLINHLFASESYRQAVKRILSGSAINNLKPSDIESLFLRLNFDNIKFDSILKSLNSMVKNKIQLEAKILTSQSLQKSLIDQMF